MNRWNPNFVKNGVARLRRWTIAGGGGTIAQGESEATFLPSDISGLVQWVDYSDITTLTGVTADGDPIGTALDKSTAANNLTGTGSARPLYKTNIKNGRACALFDYVDDRMTFAAAHNLANATIFAVINNTGNGAADSILFGNVGGNFWGDFVGTGINNSIGFNSVASTWTQNTWYVLEEFGGATGTILVNGVDKTDTTTWGNFTADQISGRLSGNLFWKGYIGEFLVYNAALSSANRTLVREYLRSRWAVYT